MNVALYIVTDGRLNLLKQTLKSFNENVKYEFAYKLLVSDCMDDTFNDSLEKLCLEYNIKLILHDEKKGFCGVYNTAWWYLNMFSGCDYAMGLEDDFTFNERIDISKMISIMEYDRNIVQVALKRQAWSIEERNKGGVVECNPDQFENKENGETKWCEHRMFYTTNPNLSPSWVLKRGWPMVERSEGIFSIELFKNPNYKSAYLGYKFEKPKCHHLGTSRNGIMY